MAQVEKISSSKCFEGYVCRYSHISFTLGNLEAKFSVYWPPTNKVPVEKQPVLYWLSGLTCTDENMMMKAGAQRICSELGLILVCPDTSPRGAGLPGEDDAYDFGTGAGFYVNATTPGYAEYYRMFDYVTKELPQVMENNFKVDNSRKSIFGHSMGGHGALSCALKRPSEYHSVSAFAPISNPVQCDWGKKAFGGYLGEENKESWKEYDATELVKQGRRFPGEILIDQGTEDNFFKQKQLLPENFSQACKSTGQRVELRFREGYDHSYYFIATFIEDHIRFHAKALLSS
ncbi:S-formylglutathione hydrolase [Galdieria sulphuraria]|uniref:S-formylglutathione hydrolase n=1 Tax=Galdieria sulphuraria TaxID=130081 RepID=M2XSY1_GALSU|nr:S-formylglutathione hydrolase [Galdieria sulphuraria]EME26534.1 S-formylglutathione hydrolase [Galdieria sulphuraria]|eukprot:XP_005703054.1 S-formylglutathione hydrolase [Galdieria sulphuraria]